MNTRLGRRAVKTTFLAVAVLLLAGCAGQATRPDDTATPDQSNRIVLASLAQEPCQSIDAAYRVRDLTKPWSQRRYLLPSNDLRTPRRMQ